MSETKQIGTPGVILIAVGSGAEAREILNRVFQTDTFLIGHDVYGDNENDWFEPMAHAMPSTEFFRRFVSKQ